MVCSHVGRRQELIFNHHHHHCYATVNSWLFIVSTFPKSNYTIQKSTLQGLEVQVMFVIHIHSIVLGMLNLFLALALHMLMMSSLCQQINC